MWYNSVRAFQNQPASCGINLIYIDTREFFKSPADNLNIDNRAAKILVLLQPNLFIMIQKTLGIYSERNEDCVLFIEIGIHHIACWCTTIQQNELKSFEYFSFDEQEGVNFEEAFRQVKLNSTLLEGNFVSTKIIWENASCICIPEHVFSDNLKQDYLHMMVGEKQDEQSFSTTVNKIKLVYHVANDRLSVIQNNYPEAELVHKYAQMIHAIDTINTSARSFVQVVFYHTHFLLMAVKDQQLQLIQTFIYKKPDAVIYHVLNVCEQLQMPVAETELVVSGLIDMQSVLYQELYKYFNLIKMDSADEGLYNKELLNGYPAHYFIPFFKYTL